VKCLDNDDVAVEVMAVDGVYSLQLDSLHGLLYEGLVEEDFAEEVIAWEVDELLAAVVLLDLLF